VQRVRVVLFLSLLLVGLAVPFARALEPGETLPDCSKIPLVEVRTSFTPSPGGAAVSYSPPSLEDMLLPDGVAIVHFCSPRPNPGTQTSFFIEELAALAKAARTVAYPCRPIPVVPLGEKGRHDTLAALNEAEAAGDGIARGVTVSYEPTWPRPGLYRTFRPGHAGFSDQEITTSWTYLIGPDRTVIAARGPGEGGQLYDWLVANLPPVVVPAPRKPSSDATIPRSGPDAWPAFRATVQHHAAAERLPDTLPYYYLAWRARVGRSFASPAVIDGRVYVVTDERGLQMLDLDTGKELGSYELGESWWTSPALAEGVIYAISENGVVVALDRFDFAEIWTRDLGGLITSSPVVVDGAFYVGSRNGTVYALDAAQGETLWEFQTGGEVSSSPCVADGLVIIGSGDRHLYAIDAATGEQRWALETGGAVDSSPIIRDRDAFVGSFDGAVYSVRLNDGRVNWRCPRTGWVHASPGADESTVFSATVNVRRDQVPTFDWLDRATGEVKGSFAMPQAVYSSPTIWGDQVLVGCRDGQLYAFDRQMRQSQPLWTYPTRGHVHASPVVVGDTVLVASFDGYLYALRQSKPIRVWTQNDLVPRWFVAALAQELHRQTRELILLAAAGEPGVEHRLTDFDPLLRQIKSEVASAAGAAPQVLPRDVPQEHPGAPFVGYVLAAGLLSGYPDATFQPSQPTTCYEFAHALVGAMQLSQQPADVWRVLRDAGLMEVQVEVRAEPISGRAPMRIVDVPDDHWAYRTLTEGAELGIVITDDEGAFRGHRRVALSYAAQQWDLIAQSLVVERTK